MYAKYESLEEDRKVFDCAKRRDTPCWNSIIPTYAYHGEAEEAVSAHERMVKEGIAELRDICWRAVSGSARSQTGLLILGSVLYVFFAIDSVCKLKRPCLVANCVVQIEFGFRLTRDRLLWVLIMWFGCVQAKRLKWVDEGFEMLVFTDNLCSSGNDQVEKLEKELQRTDILLVVDVTCLESIKWITKRSENIPNIICFGSSSGLMNKLGGSIVSNESKGSTVFGFAQSDSEKVKEQKEVAGTITEAWERKNSDDIRFCILVIINTYIRPVSVLQNLRAKGLSTLSCMISNCGPQILNCLLDPNCRKALECLNKCSPVDQVCNYRCIASYESPYLEAFSLCVLQKNNCLELDAKIPETPRVPPMEEFRGNKLCHEAAEDLFIGWLGNLDWSWRVVAGQNPAYDQFPCQYQLFYRGKARGSFWYEPVFQVKILQLEGERVWRRRKYRVKRGSVAGTFQFSVLDNGVVSNEFWTIVHVAEDLSWGLFHYHGAARVAGQSYTGAVLVSPDGQYPDQLQASAVSVALDKCGIKEWEMFMVDNCSCSDAPLSLPQGSSCLYSKIQVGDRKPSS